MRLLTDEQHASLIESLSDERYVSQYSHIVEALATLTAAPSLEVVGKVNDISDDGFHVLFTEHLAPNTELYAIKKETP